MDEIRAMNKIEVELSQEKTDFINETYQKELRHWKKQLQRVFQLKMKQKNYQIRHPQEFFLFVKKNAKMVNIDEIFFYLKSQYLTHNEEQRTFIQNIPSQENMPSFDY